jgi:acyl-CoA synthetase (AMP-forming)/AMP-acid ligase II
LPLLDHLTPGNAAPCLVFPDHVLSYAEVAAQVDEVVRRIGPARRLIAIEAAASVDFVVTYIAALSVGHVIALLPPGDAAAVAAFTADFEPDLVFQDDKGQWRMAEQAAAAQDLNPDLALMLATSGTEGRPRWVRLSRANIEANAQSIVSFLGLTAADRVAHVLPFHYSYGLSVLHSHLAAGGSIAFCGESVIAPGFIDHARKARCTGLSGVPFTYELLERIGFRERLWPELRCMTAAGGRLPPALALRYDQALKAKCGGVFVMYGQTEATARMAYVPPDQLAQYPGSIGIAIPGGRFRIRGEDGREITQAGERGELVYSGPNVMMGYATTRDDLAGGAELSELATGDIAALLPNGFICLHGRARRFSKIAGLRIGHEAIEWALRAQGIDCAVTGTDQAITLHIPGRCDPEFATRAAEAAGLPAHYVRLRCDTVLPRLASGKIDYRQLGEVLEPEPPPTPAMELVAAFRAAFYPKPVTAEDSFDSLEGDSLSYVQASLAIENLLGFVPDGWEAMPIAQLHQHGREKATPRQVTMARIESHITMRAAAILLIVVHHATLWPIPGGAAALMVMVGYGLARFHKDQLLTGRTGAFLLPMLRNLVPYFVIVAGFALAWETIPWASVLLIGNLGFADPVQKTMLPFQFWFVEAYAQLCLLMAAAFMIPAVRRSVSAHPFALGFGLLLLAFMLRYAVPLVYDIGGRKLFLLSYVLWLPALGWCACVATGRTQKLALLVAAGILCPVAAYTGGNWQGSWILYMLQFAVVATLLLVPHVSLPRPVIPALMLVSAASYHIYLFHRIVPEILGLDGLGPPGIMASVAVGIASGIAAMALQRLVFSSSSFRHRH